MHLSQVVVFPGRNSVDKRCNQTFQNDAVNNWPAGVLGIGRVRVAEDTAPGKRDHNLFAGPPD